MSKVFVTGMGIVSAMGLGIEDNLASARKGLPFARTPQVLQTKLKDLFPLAEVPFTNIELQQKLNIQSKKTYSRTSLLAILAAKEALGYAPLPPKGIALISGTSVGGMDKGENLYNGFIRHQGGFDLHDAYVHDCGDSTSKIAEYLGTEGYTATISTACSSAANAIMYAARLIKAGKIDRAIAGGTDALTKFTVSGFRSLMILSDEPCKPFDNNRKGLNLGEGAGYVLLESEEMVRTGNRKPLCELTGYANTCDAYHQTASSPDGDGAWLAISGALTKANLAPSAVSYINTHGTGTPNNDLSESIAMKRVFGETLPPFSSTKSFTGHTLGAAGGIEAVLSVLSIRDGILFPTINFEQVMTETGLRPLTSWENKPVRHVLSNSFGFGGNNTSLVFSAC